MAKDVLKSIVWKMTIVPLTSTVTDCLILAWTSAKLEFAEMKRYARWKIIVTGALVLRDSNLTLHPK